MLTVKAVLFLVLMALWFIPGMDRLLPELLVTALEIWQGWPSWLLLSILAISIIKDMVYISNRAEDNPEFGHPWFK